MYPAETYTNWMIKYKFLRDILFARIVFIYKTVAVAKLLLSACDSLYGHEPGDDTTVVAVKIRKPVNLSLMVGPPVDSEQDSAAVKKFFLIEGKNVVRGGTTSQIVARELGKEIKVYLLKMRTETDLLKLLHV